LTVIKTNRVNAEKRLHEARAEYTRREREVNPFGAKQAECEAKIATLTSKQAADRVEMDSYDEKRNDFSFWERGFGAKGLPVLVLRAALHELETYANTFMSQLLQGRIFTKLLMKGEELKIHFYAVDPVSGKVHERRYEQLSGGERRCVELSFNPFALGEMVINRCGVRVNTLIVDELTTHLGQDEKPIVCDILRDLDRKSVVVIDHDLSVQGEFDQVWDLSAPPEAVPEAEAGAA
jgi:DNA repair exonuclease SbcCD ATPase subunit